MSDSTGHAIIPNSMPATSGHVRTYLRPYYTIDTNILLCFSIYDDHMYTPLRFQSTNVIGREVSRLKTEGRIESGPGTRLYLAIVIHYTVCSTSILGQEAPSKTRR